MRDAWSPLLNYAHLSGVLARCGRAGDLRLGTALHAIVAKNPTHFRLCPHGASLHHVLAVWNSLVAMYGRCGRRGDAARVFDEMPLRDSVSWNSLLAASASATDALTLLRRMLRSAPGAAACDHATFTTVLSACARADEGGGVGVGAASLPDCTAAYVLLSNIYSSEGRWDDRGRILKRMREKGLRKDIGKSWIELEKEVRSFVMAPRSHPDVVMMQSSALVASDQEDLVESNAL